MGVTVDVKTERNVCGIVRSEVEAAGNGHARVGKIHAGNRNPFLIGQRGAVEKKAWESAPVPTRQGERGGGGSEWVTVDGKLGAFDRLRKTNMG